MKFPLPKCHTEASHLPLHIAEVDSLSVAYKRLFVPAVRIPGFYVSAVYYACF